MRDPEQRMRPNEQEKSKRHTDRLACAAFFLVK